MDTNILQVGLFYPQNIIKLTLFLGGAGEGDQQLRPEDDFEHRQQVKSDNVLPVCYRKLLSHLTFYAILGLL